MKGFISFALLFSIIAIFAIFGLAIMQAGQTNRMVDSFDNNSFGNHTIPVPAVNQSAIGGKLEAPLATFFGAFAIIAAVILIVIAVIALTSGRTSR
jgi:hypothetical protein